MKYLTENLRAPCAAYGIEFFYSIDRDIEIVNHYIELVRGDEIAPLFMDVRATPVRAFRREHLPSSFSPLPFPFSLSFSLILYLILLVLLRCSRATFIFTSSISTTSR